MIQTVLVEDDLERDGPLRGGFLQCLFRIANVFGVFDRFEPLQIVRRDDDRHRLSMPLDDDALAPVLGAAQDIREVILCGSDCQCGHVGYYGVSGHNGQHLEIAISQLTMPNRRVGPPACQALARQKIAELPLNESRQTSSTI